MISPTAPLIGKEPTYTGVTWEQPVLSLPKAIWEGLKHIKLLEFKLLRSPPAIRKLRTRKRETKERLQSSPASSHSLPAASFCNMTRSQKEDTPLHFPSPPNFSHQDTSLIRSYGVHLQGELRRVLVAETVTAMRCRFLPDTVQVPPETSMPGQHLHHSVDKATEISIQPFHQEWSVSPELKSLLPSDRLDQLLLPL